MQNNTDKQAREDEEGTPYIIFWVALYETVGLVVIASGEPLWYGWLDKRKHKWETLAPVIHKSKPNRLSLLPSYNFSLLFNPGLLSIQVITGQSVCAVHKHRER